MQRQIKIIENERHGEYVCNVINSNIRACEYVIFKLNPKT